MQKYKKAQWMIWMDSYRPFRRDRQSRQGRGVAPHVKEGSDCTVFAAESDMAESLWVRIKGKANKADGVVGVYDRSASQDDGTSVLF